ncbi:hypothetical protein ACE6H2_008144 [Prunus campanulata]
MNCCEQWKPIVAMLVINFALAMVNVLLKTTLDQGLNHLIIVTYRQSISAVFLAPIAFFWERKSIPELTSRIICQLFFSALIGLEKVNIKSKGGIAKILGALICIAGALSLTLYKGMPLTNPNSQDTTQMQNHANTMTSAKKTERWAVGSVLLGAGCLLWSSWFLIQTKVGKSYPFQYSSTAILSFFGAIQAAILYLITERNLTMSMWAMKGKLEILSVTYAGAVGSGLCYVGMSWCVKQKGALFTAAFTPTIQIFVALVDFSFFHEQIYLGSVVGSVLVIIGMYILLWGKSNDPKLIVIKHTQAAEDEDAECGPMPQNK